MTQLAFLAPRVDALFPGLAAAVLGLTNRLLPKDPGTPESAQTLEGWQAAEQLPRRTRFVLNRVTRLGRKAAERNNEGPQLR